MDVEEDLPLFLGSIHSNEHSASLCVNLASMLAGAWKGPAVLSGSRQFGAQILHPPTQAHPDDGAAAGVGLELESGLAGKFVQLGDQGGGDADAQADRSWSLFGRPSVVGGGS